MRHAQLEGLRAAAKIAFVATWTGCGGPAREAPPRDAVVVGRPDAPAPGSATPWKPQAPPDCATTLAAAFPKRTPTPSAPPEAVECCEQSLLGPDPYGEFYGACCAIPAIYSKPDGRLRAACSPWGPPTPPAMSEPDHTADASGLLDLRLEARRVPLAIDAPDASRAIAIATWRARMVNEHGSSRVFTALARQLEDAGLRSAAAEARGFAEEEVVHGIRCGAVVEALGGAALELALPHDPFPSHADAASPREAALRNVLAIACLSETVAVALIGAERAAMPEGPLRDLLTSIWADEIGHARFGWRLLDQLLASLGSAERRGLERYLSVALAHLVEHEHAHLPAGFVAPPGGESLGLCGGREARRLFAATLHRVIIPALARRGLRPRSLRGPRSRRLRPSSAPRAGAPARRAGSGRRRASSTAPSGG